MKPLQERLEDMIAVTNGIIAAGVAAPFQIESLTLLAEGRLIAVGIRFDDGTGSRWPLAASMLSPATILNVAYCSYMIDLLGVDYDDDAMDGATIHAGAPIEPMDDMDEAATHDAPETWH